MSLLYSPPHVPLFDIAQVKCEVPTYLMMFLYQQPHYCCAPAQCENWAKWGGPWNLADTSSNPWCQNYHQILKSVFILDSIQFNSIYSSFHGARIIIKSLNLCSLLIQFNSIQFIRHSMVPELLSNPQICVRSEFNSIHFNSIYSSIHVARIIIKSSNLRSF